MVAVMSAVDACFMSAEGLSMPTNASIHSDATELPDIRDGAADLLEDLNPENAMYCAIFLTSCAVTDAQVPKVPDKSRILVLQQNTVTRLEG
jgi:hypothetical protein